jgi:hypothetical protein
MSSSVKAAMPVRDRPFTRDELEKLRLLLSTFRDGSGQYLSRLEAFMPDYLAFERATALVCGGETTENKGIFDVLVPGGNERSAFGISCKMAKQQPRDRSWFMELSNSSKKFADAFDSAGVVWQNEPAAAGQIFVGLVEGWHYEVEGTVDVAASKYLLLVHDNSWGKFQVACMDLDLRKADPRTEVDWKVEGKDPARPSSVAGYIEVDGKLHRLWQLFANSGGQLKYYPPIHWAEWATEVFTLETPPPRQLRDKVEEYWPGSWPS